ncbi:hypothetical protein ACIQGZ_09235 [Streptomyces sp. NPDC092296]|uniref:WXG100-like domain-containing protein n=1 Tax=Streptomyces sp. NPDC092296 TaxID=3366012 RepID=UPI0037F4F4F6
MIELPPDLAEVLKIVQSNKHGAGIAWPNGDEDALAELADAWDTWNRAAATHTEAIVTGAAHARQNMDGEAADQYEEYLRKYAVREDSHVGTTLDAGVAVAQSLKGATHAVTQTKQEMTRELQYAKDYIASHPGGKHGDVAQSKGVMQAADTYQSYIGEASHSIDTMLRQGSTHVDRMANAGQAATLPGADGTVTVSSAGPLLPNRPSSSVADPRYGESTDGTDQQGAATGRRAAELGLDPRFTALGLDADGLDADGRPLTGAQAGAYDPQGAGGADAGGYDARSAVATPREWSGLDQGQADFGGSGSGGGSGSDIAAPRTVSALQPFSLPQASYTPSGVEGFGGSGGSGGGSPVFDTSSPAMPRLQLSGLGDLGGGAVGTGGTLGTTSALAPWTVSSSGGSTLPSFSLPSASFGGSSGLGSSGLGSGGFGGSGSGWSTGSGAASRVGGAGGGARFGGSGSGLGGGLGGRAAGGGLGGRLGSGGSGYGGVGRTAGVGSLAGEGGAAGSRGTVSGSAGGREGGVGGSAGTRTSAAGGAAGGAGGARSGGGLGGGGGHGGGGGRAANRSGRRYVRATPLGDEEFDDEDGRLTDAGVTGDAVAAPTGDRHWQRMRRRWMDTARSEAAEPSGADGGSGPARTAEAGGAAAAPDATEGDDLLMQLRSAVLGPEPGEGAGTPPTGGEAQRPTEPATGTPEADHLDRSRAVAARRGLPDGGAGTGAAAAGEPRTPPPLRQEEGYAVPSPFLRTALSRMAASGAFENRAAGAGAGAGAGQAGGATAGGPER